MSIGGHVEAKCKECSCRFIHTIDNWIFIDEEVTGTCDKCFEKESHQCVDELQDFTIVGEKIFTKEEIEQRKIEIKNEG